MDEDDSDGGGGGGGDCILRKPPPPPPATLYYLESYFADCLVANRIVTRVPFAGPRERIVPILGIAIVVHDSRYSRQVRDSLSGSSSPPRSRERERETGKMEPWKDEEGQPSERPKTVIR